MLAATYHADGLWGEATFDLYPRALPGGWGYLVAAGLEPVLTMLESFRFTEEEVAQLRSQAVFSKIPASFFDALSRLTFTGDVHAVAEGTPVFPNEPVLRVTAPIWVATLLETRLVQLVGASTAVASRAARLADAAGSRSVLDFGSRRSAGAESAGLAARAAWIGGVAVVALAGMVFLGRGDDLSLRPAVWQAAWGPPSGPSGSRGRGPGRTSSDRRPNLTAGQIRSLVKFDRWSNRSRLFDCRSNTLEGVLV